MNASGELNSDRYWLSARASVCRTGDYFVLLDERKGRYLGARTADLQRLGDRIEGWPWQREASSLEDEADEADVGELLAQLLESGMLTRDKRSGKISFDTQIEPRRIAIIEGYAEVRYQLHFRDVANFLRATFIALGLVKCCSFDMLTKYIRLRRARLVLKTVEPTQLEGEALERARSHVAAFRALRPLLLRRGDACLLNSLALREFLSRYEVFPQWVLGVRTAPFGAHCWLQQNGIIFNDTPEYVGQFTPILAI